MTPRIVDVLLRGKLLVSYPILIGGALSERERIDMARQACLDDGLCSPSDAAHLEFVIHPEKP